MKANVLDLHFLGSLKKHRKGLAEHKETLSFLAEKLEGVENAVSEARVAISEVRKLEKEQQDSLHSLTQRLQGLENTVSKAKAGASASFNKKIDTVFKNYCKELDQKSEEFEEAIYTAQRCKQRLDSMIPYWSNRLLQQDGKLLDYDDKFSAINKRIAQQETDCQEQMKMVDTLLEIVESDINKEEALDARLKKLEIDMERIYELMAQQVTETKPIVVTETLQNLEFAELEKPKPIAQPAVKKIFDNKENKKPITSEYAKYFNDKTVQKVEANLFEDVIEKKEVKNTAKQPIKHAKTKSVGIDPFKKK